MFYCNFHNTGDGRIILPIFNLFFVLFFSVEEEASSEESVTSSPEDKLPTPVARPSYPLWVSESEWKQCQYLDATLPLFAGLCVSLCTNVAQWKQFKMSENPFLLMEKPFVPGMISITLVFMSVFRIQK